MVGMVYLDTCLKQQRKDRLFLVNVSVAFSHHNNLALVPNRLHYAPELQTKRTFIRKEYGFVCASLEGE
jgi:hypothetical protein